MVGVIKHDKVGSLAREAVVLDLGDLARQAETLRRAAEREAEQIVIQARAERERLIGDAAARGHAEGLARGLEEGRRQGQEAGRAQAMAAHAQRLEALGAGWAQALETFARERAGYIVDCRAQVLSLAVEMASLVTHRVLRTDGSVVLDQIEAALRAACLPSRAVIEVAAEDLELASAAMPALAARLSLPDGAEVRAASSLTPGSCRVRATGGPEIDASVQTQLARIAALIVPERAALALEGEGGALAASELPSRDVAAGELAA